MGNTSTSPSEVLYIKFDHDQQQQQRPRSSNKKVDIVDEKERHPSTSSTTSSLTPLAAPTVLAGSTITGRICIDLSAIPVYRNRDHRDYKLLLRLTGKEKSQIRTTSKLRRAERQFLFHETLVHDFSQEEAPLPGTHEFSFSLELPNNLPGSMKCERVSSLRLLSLPSSSSINSSSTYSTVSCAEIQYKVKALLLPVKPSSSRIKSILKAEKVFFVNAAAKPPVIVPYFVQPVSYEIKALGVMKLGMVMFGASVRSTHVSRGDEIHVTVSCRNGSTVDIENVDLSIVERVMWRIKATPNADTDRTKPSSTLSVDSIASAGGQLVERKLVHTQECLFQPKMTKTEVFCAKFLKPGINQAQENYAHIFDELRAGSNKFQLQVPMEALDTYSGPLVEVTHHLVLQIRTESHADNARVEIPLQIRTYQASRTSKFANNRDGEKWLPLDDNEFELSSSAVVNAMSMDFLLNSSDMIHTIPDRLAAAAAAKGDPPPPLTSLVSVPSAEMKLGGFARDLNSLLCGETEASETCEKGEIPSLENLLNEMLASVDDFYLVSTRSADPLWEQVFSLLTPEQTGSIIAHVKMDFDQPKVASLIASHLAATATETRSNYRRPTTASGFSCQHFRAALENAAPWTRINMVQRLLPYCNKLAENRECITDVLTAWELTVTASDFEEALRIEHLSPTSCTLNNNNNERELF